MEIPSRFNQISSDIAFLKRQNPNSVEKFYFLPYSTIHPIMYVWNDSKQVNLILDNTIQVAKTYIGYVSSKRVLDHSVPTCTKWFLKNFKLTIAMSWNCP